MTARRYLLSVCLLLCWGSSQFAGAQQIMPRLVRQISPPPSVNFNTVGATEDAQGNLWFATNEGVVRFDGRQFKVYHDPVLRQGDDYFHVIPSPDGRIWCKLGRGSALSYVDPRLDKIVRVPDSTRLVREYLAKVRSNYVFADADANLWIGLRGSGLLKVNTLTYAIDVVFDKKKEAVRCITQDRRGSIWFTTNQGVYSYNPASGTVRQYRDGIGSPNRDGTGQPTSSLRNNFVLGIHVRWDGAILVGLNNEVDIINPVTGQVNRIELMPSKLMPVQEVFDFHDDERGNTYFRTPTASYRYTRRGDLQQLEFSSITQPVKYLFPSRTNRLWVTAGQTLLEYDLARVRALSPLNLLDVVINGTRLEGATAKQQLVRDSLGHPTLTVQEADLIRLRISPYVGYTTRAFRLRLEDYDRQWNVVEEAENSVSYQLLAGTYTLALNRFINPHGWEKKTSTLTLVVEPPFWKTPWFLFVSFMIVAGSGFGVFRNWNRRRKLRQELARREFEAANLREMDEIKSRFFANITHEFRTPLTIILNATEQLASASLNPPEQKRVESVQRNAHQLLRLVHETLDIAKLDAGKLDRRDHVGDPVGFVEQVVAQFRGLADQNQVRLDWIGDSPLDGPESRLYGFDDDKLEKITYNLLANALKFTPAGGLVRVDARLTTDHRFALRVADTGIGIPPDQLTRIFERFHQVDNSSTRAYSGTGIGLALVKELTDWLGGTVAVESTVGTGSVFSVELPLTLRTATELPDAVLHSPFVNDGSTGLVRPDSVPSYQPVAGQPKGDNRPLVLVVEDNDELRTYVEESFSTDYRVVTAENGRRGLEQAIAQVPDLIVSDVMMPEMDGYELVERLKADERTSHIPLVLLTAKSSYDSRMKGLGAGADDYLSKPFSLAELSLRIGNCLTTRQNWQRRLTMNQVSAGFNPSPDPRLTKEAEFLNRLRHLILDHLVDEAVDVDWLAAQAQMSRTQLHRKLTALTNLSTTRFIHSVRLEKAVDLLQTGELNVAQAAQAVGYTSQSYFTKVFQEHFGYLPKSLRV